MHPAYSVILFTTASGAGYGLLAWLALAALMGTVPAGTVYAVIAFGLALALVAGGLLASTAHLGRPERAWRALSQWRTSWLSREGVAAVATFLPAGLFALAWLGNQQTTFLIALLAILTIAGAAATVWCTGMIYASLRTVPAWHQSLVAPLYLVLALATGGVLHLALLALFAKAPGVLGWPVVVAILAGWLMKTIYWGEIDARVPAWTAEDATGLGRFGTVRPLEPPHTEPNFVMREMGYAVARSHADRLRRIAQMALFAAPALLTMAVIALGATPLALLAALLAVLSAGLGVVVERWLFFAEARHVVTVFYDGGAV